MRPCHFPQLDGQLKTVSDTLRNGLDIREDFKFLGLLFKVRKKTLVTVILSYFTLTASLWQALTGQTN